MFERLVIIGAGGHGKVIADIAVKCGYQNICFVDDKACGSCMDFPIVGGCDAVPSLHDGRTGFVIAVGSNAARQCIAQKYDLPWATLIHPSAQIGCRVSVGHGTVVMANAVINPCTAIGAHCIVNSGAVVEHDNILRDFVHISPRAALAGTVTVGALTHIGIGALVKNNVNITEGCVIGAGAVVVEDIVCPGVYIGVPAKILKEKAF